MYGLRGTGPALAGKLWRGSAFARCAMEGLIASNARSGPIPLRCGFRGLRGTGPALAGKLGERIGFRAVRDGGFDRFQCSLRRGPAAAEFGPCHG